MITCARLHGLAGILLERPFSFDGLNLVYIAPPELLVASQDPAAGAVAKRLEKLNM